MANGSLFCSACGTGVARSEPPLTSDESNVETFYILMLGLAGMLIFFAFGFLLAGLVAEPAFLTVAAILTLVGAIMIAVGLWSRKKLKRAIKDRKANDRCEYCGGDNATEDNRCRFCGAPRW
jgi:hypothetical protein